MKLLKLFLPLTFALTLAACAPTSPNQVGQPPAVVPVAVQGRVIPITAELWKWAPNVIQAKKDEVVTLQVTGISGTHGFSVPDLGIDQTIFMGKTVNIPLPTGKAGSFPFACSFQCGSGHADMKGQIIITE
jgi:cytochrome c oxidase subunit 2